MKKRGATIVELLVSLAIFVIIMIPVTMLILSSVHFSKRAEQKQQSMIIAQNIVEQIKSTNNNDLIYGNLGLKVNGKTIKCLQDTKGNLNIHGNYKGYNISGNVEFISTNQKVNQKKDMNIYINEDNGQIAFSVLDKNNNILMEKTMIENSIINIQDNQNNILINNYEILKNNNLQKDISVAIFFDNEKYANKYNVSVDNNCTDKFNVYIYRKKGKTLKPDVNVENLNGNFNVIPSCIIEDKNSSDNLCKIYVKVSKKEDAFETTSYKNMK